MFFKWLFLNILQNSQENTCAGISCWYNCRPPAYNFIEKGTLTQVLFCKHWEPFYEYLFYTEHLQMTASGFSLKLNIFDGYSSGILMKRLRNHIIKILTSSQEKFSLKLAIFDKFLIQIESHKSLCLES